MAKKRYSEPEEKIYTLQDSLREEYGRKTIEEKTVIPSYFQTILHP